MGRINHDRHIRLEYPPLLIEYWKRLSREDKDNLNSIGKVQGYAGQNVLFYTFLGGALDILTPFEREDMIYKRSG